MKRVYSILSSKEFGVFIMALIILNIVAIVLESHQEVYKNYSQEFYIFEVFSVIIFSVEYIARFFSAKFAFPDSRLSRLKFVFSTMGIIDLLAILPFYVPFLIPLDLRFIRLLRIIRIIRIAKLQRHSESIRMITDCFKERKYELLVTLYITLIILLVASILMFYLEKDAQPTAFPNISATVWWAVATLTTIGYGDVYPITVGGKVLASLIAFLGIGLVAIPTGLLAGTFTQKMQEKRNSKEDSEVE